MKTRVLVIEDNPADFRLLQEALRDVRAVGVQLTHALSLSDALKRLSEGGFDVALLDLSLPDTDGLEGLEQIQREAPELPVLVVTGRNDSELAVKAVREGAQDYLIKGTGDGHLLLRAMHYARERKQALQQLRRSEERFRSLLEHALDIITVLGADGRITYASPSTERVLGYLPDEMVGRSIAEFVDPDDLERTQEFTGPDPPASPVRREFRVRCKGGGWRVIEAVGRSLLDDPSIHGIVINARDVTERKASEARIREVNHYLQAVIETTPLPIYVLDLDGCVQGWNRAASEVFGWPESEVLGRELPAVPEHGRSAFRTRLANARLGRATRHFETKYLHKNGSHLDLNIWNSLLRDAEGEPKGIVAIVVDVTERKKLEEQFRQAQKMEAIGRLAGGVAHDFNNLLTIITGYSQIAFNREPAGSPTSQDLREVLQAADRAASLTRQLLALSRRQVVEPATVDMNSVVADTERMLHRILGENIRLTTRLGSDLTPVRVDRGQMELVLLNLVVNAQDAMPSGGDIRIETAEVELHSDDIPARAAGLCGRAIMLAVSDTGVGMSEEVRAQIFEPFFTTKEPGKGTGLGLPTSYGIIRQHGGDIWVYSEPGVGTTFKIYLPVSQPDPAHEPYEAPRQERAAGGTETILLVEDDSAVAGILRETLQQRGYRVLPAGGSEEALDIVVRHPGAIHLLLTDVVLQSAHGVELARQVRELRPGISVLYVSGYTGPSAPGKPFLETNARFLQKPFAPEVLAAKVREVLDEKRSDR